MKKKTNMVSFVGSSSVSWSVLGSSWTPPLWSSVIIWNNTPPPPVLFIHPIVHDQFRPPLDSPPSPCVIKTD